MLMLTMVAAVVISSFGLYEVLHAEQDSAGVPTATKHRRQTSRGKVGPKRPKDLFQQALWSQPRDIVVFHLNVRRAEEFVEVRENRASGLHIHVQTKRYNRHKENQAG